MPPIEVAPLLHEPVGAGGRAARSGFDALRRELHAVRHQPPPVLVVLAAAAFPSRSRHATSVHAISPLSTSSSLFRQQRPQPSQSDSHSAPDISSSDFFRQKGMSSMAGHIEHPHAHPPPP